MKKLFFLASLLSVIMSTQAQSTCDTCTQLTTLNAYAQDTSTNTATTSNLLNKLLETVTRALFGVLPALGNGNMMAALSIMPAVQSKAYDEQKTLLHSVEAAYQQGGENNADTSAEATFDANYSAIFGNYLLQEKNSSTSFDMNNTSIAALYLDPSKATYYDETQQAQAETFIKLASGVAMSHLRKPSSDWLTIRSDHKDEDINKIRTQVSTYYTYSALQSAIADNFTYIYGLNKGQKITGTLTDYSGNSISESGLFTYIKTQKPENPDWYKQLAGMGAVGLLREQTILMGGCFLILSRMEEDLRRLLVTNSAQTSLILMAGQALSQTSAQTANLPTIPTIT